MIYDIIKLYHTFNIICCSYSQLHDYYYVSYCIQYIFIKDLFFNYISNNRVPYEGIPLSPSIICNVLYIIYINFTCIFKEIVLFITTF